MQICYRTVVIYRSNFKTEKKGKIIEFKIEGNYKLNEPFHLESVSNLYDSFNKKI